MARKVFISILGTGYYLKTKYYFGEHPTDNEKISRFIQEPTIEKYCKDWTSEDAIFIFLTKEARKENWVEDSKKEHPDGSYTGLSKVLDNLNLKAKIRDINIDDGLSENEIWNIFDEIFKVFEKGDKVHFDITHAFRYLPMLSMVLINYAKFLKDISVEKITYGAFEKLGPAYKVKKIDVAKRFAPILDLTSLALLQDWTNAAGDYINFGDAKNIHSLTEKSTVPLIKNDANEKYSAITLKNFTNKLFDYTQNIKTVRGFEIYSGRQSKIIKEKIKTIKEQSFIKPLIPLLERIEKSNKDDNNSLQNIFNAVGYCIEHNLIQQGITFFQEGIISLVLSNSCIAWYVPDKQDNHKDIERNRNLASSALNYLERKKDENFNEQSWHFSYWDKENIDKILNDELAQNLSSLYNKLSKLRNDINHSGFIEKRSNKSFLADLKVLFEEFEMQIETLLK